MKLLIRAEIISEKIPAKVFMSRGKKGSEFFISFHFPIYGF